jgi:hypothetical protein
MKKILFIALISMLVLLSCSNEPTVWNKSTYGTHLSTMIPITRPDGTIYFEASPPPPLTYTITLVYPDNHMISIDIPKEIYYKYNLGELYKEEVK